ncbi:mRNA splicing protein SMX2 SCDLUD_000691 [Saccharomycodes ludwigii]|uniref:mRNA splicing protein SMX2 n=1 Tax=Saccharomycodes ludwigii TaxID=36035 RepID=UPI001E8A08CF|nr:hypothetical protein SCDLUD_000691 [Saccharomycodes ludwigii]KAH3903080.1 hypothetical protein SCDLUD_000691 [Saccharomycodes ludwigii]
MVSAPELKKYMGHKIMLQLNGSRKVIGILKGYDLYLNVVLENAIEIVTLLDKNTNKKKKDVEPIPMGFETIVRGNSIVSLESLQTV